MIRVWWQVLYLRCHGLWTGMDAGWVSNISPAQVAKALVALPYLVDHNCGLVQQQLRCCFLQDYCHHLGKVPLCQ